MRKKLGVIVNPVAGLGGRVGLKGSDGPEILARARQLGARPEGPRRTVTALEVLRPLAGKIELIAYPQEMGEDEAREIGWAPTVIGSIQSGCTSAQDTRQAARDMEARGVDLLLFAGGDGTARDICAAVGGRLPVLGIPTGVKMHSAVYATSPVNAGRLAAEFLTGPARGLRLAEAEVMDIDEEAFREGRISAKLYGYLRVPSLKNLVQCPKAGGCAGEAESLAAIAAEVVKGLEPDRLYLVGTGTTTRAVMDRLGLPNTLLGVDAVLNRRLVGSDLNEKQILDLIQDRPVSIIVGVIGAQGYIFGRGNQQISARVIARAGRENIIVVATLEKLMTLRGRPLLVDTGSPEVDRVLAGYLKVVTGLDERTVFKVEC
ncbi:MAG: ATP-NAD kinase family protein [Thermodesulfobacteriota bacterium]